MSDGCLGCNGIELTERLVTLHDGRIVCNTCQDWLQECEARELLAMGNQARIDALSDRAKRRGKEAVERLRVVMAAIYRAREQ